MQALPGMTPDRVWDLPFIEWIIIADFTDRWAQAQRDRAAEARHKRG